MSRVAKRPVTLPKGVTHTVDGSTVTVKGAKGALKLPLRPGLSLVQEGNDIRIEIADRNKESLMHAGSLRSHLANMARACRRATRRSSSSWASATVPRPRARS